jgi:hypothetical protein
MPNTVDSFVVITIEKQNSLLHGTSEEKLMSEIKLTYQGDVVLGRDLDIC